MKKTILITGCNNGIGRVTAKYFHTKGWNVAATVRTNPKQDQELNALDNMLVAELDVTKEDTIKAAVKATIGRFGKIDVLLNNAGCGIYGVLESIPESDIRQQFDVNVIGTLMVIQNVLPFMRAQGEGIILNVSSMAGKVTFPLGTLYHGSKFAVEGMSEAMSYELESIGIKVKLIQPGMVNTNFSARASASLNFDRLQKEYYPFLAKCMPAMQKLQANHCEPIKVTETIYKAATDGTNQMRYVIGEDAQQLITSRMQMSDDAYLSMVRNMVGL